MHEIPMKLKRIFLIYTGNNFSTHFTNADHTLIDVMRSKFRKESKLFSIGVITNAINGGCSSFEKLSK